VTTTRSGPNIAQSGPAGRRTAVGLLRSCHPEPGAAVTVGSALLAVSTGRDARGVVVVAAAVAASQLAVGWHNDWLDAERDAQARRTDKPLATGAVSRRAVGIAAVVATIATVPLALLSGPWAGLAATIGLLSSLAYNWPGKFTALSVVPYVISFAALPAFVVLGLPGHPAPPWWLLAAGASLGGGAHFANVLSDLDDDERTGVRGLPHRLGARWSAVAAGVLLAVTSALLVFGPGSPRPLAMAGLAVAIAVLVVGLGVQWRVPTSKAGFRAVLVAALIDVALLLTAGAVV
jgi:protoheme IX farnesyltransferase